VNKANRSTGSLFLAISQVVAFSCLLFLHIGAMAQQASDGNLAASPVGGSADNSAPLQASSSAVQLLPAAEPAAEPPRNFKERFQDYRSATFSPWAVVMPAFGAGLSQWRNYPPEWNQGTEGFGKRVASAYGGSVLEDTISFGVATFDHEDLALSAIHLSQERVSEARRPHPFIHGYSQERGRWAQLRVVAAYRSIWIGIHCEYLVSGATL
jgi:hypothetical protein